MLQFPPRIARSFLMVLTVALLLPVASAQASEVVKLARLVITGKRISAEPPRQPAAPEPEAIGKPGQPQLQPLESQHGDSPQIVAEHKAALRVL